LIWILHVLVVTFWYF